jgi:predicted XRE-type DNA-binding protein
MRKLSDNLFRDFGIDDADEEKAKIEAVALILDGLETRGWKAADLARAAGMAPANISEILNLKLDRYSIGRLNRVLSVFGKKIAVAYRVVDATQ